MADVKYHYALDEHEKLVSISQISEEDRHLHIYHCINCGEVLVPKIGSIRAHHFAHSVSEGNHCNSETYLHKLAKFVIKEYFKRCSTFYVSYYQYVNCSEYSICPFFNKKECVEYKLVKYDLKSYYDSCSEEKMIRGFKADILLTNSKKLQRKPLLIEIQVSHKTTVQKQNSGMYIIEIPIESEKDIEEAIVSSIEESKNARFYGFNKISSDSERLGQRTIPRFYLYPSGKAYYSSSGTSCRSVQLKDNNKSIFEVSFDKLKINHISPYLIGFYAAYERGFCIKTCYLCKYHEGGYGSPFGYDPLYCTMHNKKGTPEYPESHQAKKCEFYTVDHNLMERLRSCMPPVVVAKDTRKELQENSLFNQEQQEVNVVGYSRQD